MKMPNLMNSSSITLIKHWFNFHSFSYTPYVEIILPEHARNSSKYLEFNPNLIIFNPNLKIKRRQNKIQNVENKWYNVSAQFISY